jgi:hypothetical protein
LIIISFVIRFNERIRKFVYLSEEHISTCPKIILLNLYDVERKRLEKDRLESSLVANYAFENYSESTLVEIRQTHYCNHHEYHQPQQQEEQRHSLKCTIVLMNQLPTRC